MRGVITIIYFDEDAIVAKPQNKNQLNDLNTWLPDATIGQVAATRLNPVLYYQPGLIPAAGLPAAFGARAYRMCVRRFGVLCGCTPLGP